jgi:hypothetical protein
VIDFAAVRDLAVALDDVDEGTWYGAAAFRVKKKVFARRHENDPDLVLIKVGPDERDALVAMHPDRFLRTEHPSERDDSVLLRLSASTEDDLVEIGELLDAAWHRISGR